MTEVMRGALFLDRDGTIIKDAHYLANSTLVELLRDSPNAIQLANSANVPVVVVTNQSGIGRGLITEAQYESVRQNIDALLLARGASVTATYHCPHSPENDLPCDCRKPLLGMYLQAAREHALDLAMSAYIGDRWRDVEPALKVGGLGILVPSTETPTEDVALAESEALVLPDLTHAVQHALEWMKTRSPHDTNNA